MDLVFICRQLGPAVIAVQKLYGCLGPGCQNLKNLAIVLLVWLPCTLK